MNAFPPLRATLQAALSPLSARFERELRAPQAVQQKLLASLIHNAAASEYGQSLRLKATDDYSAFAVKAPLVRYDDLSEWIALQQSCHRRVIAAEPVLFYEKTSGSSGAAKHIPYTRGLKSSFQRMFLLWLSDLLRHGPKLSTGKVFLSISPNFRRNEITASGTRIGLEDDTEYLSAWVRWLLKPFLVAPPALARLQSPTHFKHILSLHLLADADLAAVSIWNPSFLTILLQYIQAHRTELSADLKRGEATAEGMHFRFARMTQRRLALLTEADWPQLWPQLKLISCWNSAHAATAAQELSEWLPHIFMQGKGLLATEAPVTFPLMQAGGCVPLPSEVFYEFLTDDGGVRLLHELTTGSEYEIVITQKGGLTRYRTGDRVRVTQFYKAAPCLEFIGRNDAVCDLVGEKLNEIFVRDCLVQLRLPVDCFHLLAPDLPARQYRLWIDRTPADSVRLEEELERLLCESFHYRNARLLGQLRPAIVTVRHDLRAAYHDCLLARGMKWGDIKPQALLTSLDNAARLAS